VGIGRPPKGIDPAEYVLASFDEIERPYLNEMISVAAQSISVALLEGPEAAMNRFQKKINLPFQSP
jgi:PTH1 family peptidyl-tRNA hydrolase